MENILVDIRKENDDIREIFANKDLISIEDLLNKVDELNYELKDLQQEFDNYKEKIKDNYISRW